jgi:hypothetical protein
VKKTKQLFDKHWKTALAIIGVVIVFLAYILSPTDQY